MDAAMRSYYERRAPEYDDWWLGTGRFAARERPGWHEDVAAVCAALEALPPARTLDVACGTGFLTAHLPGDVCGLDQSPTSIEIASARLPDASFVVGDAMSPPPGEFERVHAGHFYGHLLPDQRADWLRIASGLAPELVITDSARRDRDEAWDERILNDGSRHQVYKRWFTPDSLLAELGGGEILHAGPWFLAVLHQGSDPSVQ